MQNDIKWDDHTIVQNENNAENVKDRRSNRQGYCCVETIAIVF